MFAIFPACAAWDASEVRQHEVLQDERKKHKENVMFAVGLHQENVEKPVHRVTFHLGQYVRQ